GNQSPDRASGACQPENIHVQVCPNGSGVMKPLGNKSPRYTSEPGWKPAHKPRRGFCRIARRFSAGHIAHGYTEIIRQTPSLPGTRSEYRIFSPTFPQAPYRFAAM